MPAIEAPERQEDQDFEVNLDYTVRLDLNLKAKTNKKGQQ